MDTNHRMIDRRRRTALLVGHRILRMAASARKIEVVHGTQRRDARFPPRVEALVGAVHVAEMRLAAAPRHDLAVDDRRLPATAAPRAVGVPDERALVGMATVRPAVR